MIETVGAVLSMMTLRPEEAALFAAMSCAVMVNVLVPERLAFAVSVGALEGVGDAVHRARADACGQRDGGLAGREVLTLAVTALRPLRPSAALA